MARPQNSDRRKINRARCESERVVFMETSWVAVNSDGVRPLGAVASIASSAGSSRAWPIEYRLAWARSIVAAIVHLSATILTITPIEGANCGHELLGSTQFMRRIAALIGIQLVMAILAQC